MEKWSISISGWSMGGPVIDDNGIIYLPADKLYAIYPNGTIKWSYDVPHSIHTTPAIDENGIIYVGTMYASPNYLWAFYPNGTVKWKYNVGHHVGTSITIGSDGNIYFGDDNGYLNALYPNGTLKWNYLLCNEYWNAVRSSPAIDNNEVIYCGAQDGNLFAFYPNGTVKWKFKCGSSISTSPCIADDGTIYVGDGELYAVNPNGTLEWVNGGGGGCSPTIANDGTVYTASAQLDEDFMAVYPNNGTTKWRYPLGELINMWKATPAISSEGTIYFGTEKYNGGYGEIVALHPNGTLYWRKRIANDFCQSPPAIGKDGAIYIPASNNLDEMGGLHAFGIGEYEVDVDGPYFDFTDNDIQFSAYARNGTLPYSWFWDFGDGNNSTEQNPVHRYESPGNYTVMVSVKDGENITISASTWAWIQESNNPPNVPIITGEVEGSIYENYFYTFVTSDPDGSILYFYIEWGDGADSGWIGAFNSGEECVMPYRWSEEGTYVIRAKARDPYNEESDWAYLEVTMPVNQPVQYPLFNWFLERFPNTFPILRNLLGL